MESPKIDLYTFNRMAMANIEEINQEDKNTAIKKINNYHNYKKNSYYLLINHDLRYVTMLGIVNINKETLGEAVFECLENIGKVIQIDQDEQNGLFECWVKVDDLVHAIMLFSYDNGVVKVGGTK